MAAAAGDSSKPLLVVFTANSNTGMSAIENLTALFPGDFRIRAVVRKKDNAEGLEEFPNVEVVTGDINKGLILGPVFHGASAAYFAVPTTTNRAELAKKFVDACMKHGVQYAIMTSIVGADEKATVYQKQFAEIEEYTMSMAGKAVTVAKGDKGSTKFQPIIMRTGMFYQNLYGSLGGIQAGTLYYPLGLGKMAHTDFNDVGKCIAHALRDPARLSGGKIYNLIGEYQAGNQVASAISMKAGVACKYQDVDDETAASAFQALGLQEWIATGNVETLRWFRSDRGQDIASDIKAITGDEPTRFGAFVKDCFKPMLDSA